MKVWRAGRNSGNSFAERQRLATYAILQAASTQSVVTIAVLSPTSDGAEKEADRLKVAVLDAAAMLGWVADVAAELTRPGTVEVRVSVVKGAMQ